MHKSLHRFTLFGGEHSAPRNFTFCIIPIKNHIFIEVLFRTLLDLWQPLENFKFLEKSIFRPKTTLKANFPKNPALSINFCPVFFTLSESIFREI